MPPSEQPGQLLDLHLIQQLHEAIGDQLGTLLPPFIAFVEQCLNDISLAAYQKNCSKIVQLSHSLKGSAASLGAQALADCAAFIEQEARSSNLPAVQFALPELERTATATVGLLREQYIKSR